MKMQCNNCKTKFVQSNEHFVADHTGFEGIYIDVCPVCISDDIFEIIELSPEQRLLQMWADAFINKCIQNKQSTNDANLIIHYTNLISDTQLLLKKILA